MNQRPILYKHPGKVGERRVLTKRLQPSIAFHRQLLPGAVLGEELVRACRSHGFKSASVNLVGGFFDSFEYCLAWQDPDVQNKINYMPSKKETGIVMLICANATIGIGEDGGPLVHCHGLVTAHNGVPIGGHFFANRIKVCKQPVTAFFTGLVGAGFRQMYDDEVTHSIFKPATL